MYRSSSPNRGSDNQVSLPIQQGGSDTIDLHGGVALPRVLILMAQIFLYH